MVPRRSAACAAVMCSLLAVGASPALGGLSPILSTISPSSGSTAGGTVVTITGSLLNNCGYSPVSVRFGGVLATQAQSISSTEVRATTPAFGTPGAVDVQVICQLSTTRSSWFTYVTPAPDPQPDPNPTPEPVPAPTPASSSTPAPGATTPAPVITAITPGGASAVGGQVVLVAGGNLTGASAVAFTGASGTVPARGFTVVSDERLSVTVPALRAGSWTVTLTTPGGVASRTGFVVVAQPSSGAAGGAAASIAGPQGAGTFSTWIAVPPGVASIGPRPRYVLGATQAAREAGAPAGTACTRSAVVGSPPRVRITCPVSPALRVALADGSARVSIRMTARAKGSSVVIPLRPVAVTVRRAVRRLAVTG